MPHDRTVDYKSRDEQILELAFPPNKLSDVQIGEMFGLTRVRIMQIRHKYLRECVSPLVEYYRTFIASECMRGIEALAAKVDNGEPAAAGAHQRYLERLAKLYGTDAPELSAHLEYAQVDHILFGGKEIASD